MFTQAPQTAARRAGLATLFVSLLFCLAARGQDPPGDYGDAPDSAAQFFPTKYATANSRLGWPGVHHVNTGQETIGFVVSNENGAEDPLDPDGWPNLSGGDSDDGLVVLYVTSYGSPFGRPLVRFTLEADYTIAAGAPAGPRYLNVLVDANRDQQWRNTGTSQEWVAINLPLNVAPGTHSRLRVPLGIFFDPFSPAAPPADMWMRMTLTRDPIPTAATNGLGGWDGSGVFEYGETEDYRLFYSTDPAGGMPGWTPDVPVSTWPPPSGCWFNIRGPDIVKLDHCGGSVEIRVFVTMTGGGPGNSWILSGFTVDPDGPAFGVGIVNGAAPGEVGTPGFNGNYAHVQVNPTCDPPERIQSFGLIFRFQGFGPGGQEWAASHTVGVIIFHDNYPIFGLDPLRFDPNQPNYPPGSVVPVGPSNPGQPPMGYIVFGNEQPTGGTITLGWRRGLPPPGLPPQTPGVLPMSWFWDVEFDPPGEDWVPGEPEVETQIVGLILAGYEDEMLAEAGVSDESTLHPVKMPYYPHSYYDLGQEATTDVGAFFAVDPAANMVWIEQPYGFSLWTLQGDTAPPLPCPGDLNCDGYINFGDINPFVLYLSNYAAWQDAYPDCSSQNGDINGDGLYPSFGDINPFVALLSDGGGPCPE